MTEKRVYTIKIFLEGHPDWEFDELRITQVDEGFMNVLKDSRAYIHKGRSQEPLTQEAVKKYVYDNPDRSVRFYSNGYLEPAEIASVVIDTSFQAEPFNPGKWVCSRCMTVNNQIGFKCRNCNSPIQ